MADDPKPADTGEAPKDISFWQTEAKKAFEARDQLKAKARELEARVLSEGQLEEYERLRKDAVLQEEDRKRKAGEFETWRATIQDAHKKETATLAEQLTSAQARLKDTLVGLAFAGAAEWFGGPQARTILPAAIAQSYLGKYVEVTDVDGVPTVQVKDATGAVILDPSTGKPAAFAQALERLIDALPDKDTILRGSGKVGSGSAGGTLEPTRPPDLDALIARAKAGDKEALAALRKRQASLGGMVMGAAFQ